MRSESGADRRAGLGLVPLDPARARAAVVGAAPHHRPGEPARPTVVVAQQHRPEGNGRHVDDEVVRPARRRSSMRARRRESVLAHVLGHRQGGDGVHRARASGCTRRTPACPGCGCRPGGPGSRRRGAASTSTIRRPTSHARPRSGPAGPARRRERLAVDGDGAGHEAGDLVAGRERRSGTGRRRWPRSGRGRGRSAALRLSPWA